VRFCSKTAVFHLCHLADGFDLAAEFVLLH